MGGSAYLSTIGDSGSKGNLAPPRRMAARHHLGGDGSYGGSRLPAPPRVASTRWNPELKLQLGGTMSPQILYWMRAVLGDPLPSGFAFAVKPALFMALCRE